MHFVTISVDLTLSNPQELRSHGHQFANLVNVVHAELQLLERMCEPHGGLKPAIRLCETAVSAFKNPNRATENAAELEVFEQHIDKALEGLVARSEYQNDVEDARRLIEDVLGDVNLRVQETLARYGANRTWHATPRAEALAQVEAGYRRVHGSSETSHDLDVRIETETSVAHGLLSSIGRLAGMLIEFSSGPVTVCLRGNACPVEIRAPGSIPGHESSGIPTTLKGETPAAKLRAHLALLSYLVSGRAEVQVRTIAESDENSPLVRICLHES